MRRAVPGSLALLLTSPPQAWADGGSVVPEAWWRAWSWDPLVALSLAVLAGLYQRGRGRLSSRSTRGRVIRSWQPICFFAALLVLGIGLLSPLDALSGELSSLHMVQHTLLISVAAPLFVLGSPAVAFAWSLDWKTLPGRSLLTFFLRLPQASILWRPEFAWTAFAVSLWVWHHPLLYQAALRDPLLHDAQHLSFFIGAWLFWRACLDPLSARRLHPAVAIFYLFSTFLHASVLGIFLALSPRVWYEHYAATTTIWGLTPLEDQQLAGLIMWMPGCVVYPVAAVVLFGTWLAVPSEDASFEIAKRSRSEYPERSGARVAPNWRGSAHRGTH